MKRRLLVAWGSLCVVVCCGLAMADASRHQTDVGVFLRPDASCTPANFAMYGSCYTILSTDPIVCGFPLVGYAIFSKSLTKQLPEIGYFVSMRDTTVEGEVCGKPLYRFKDIKRGVPPPCPQPQECP